MFKHCSIRIHGNVQGVSFRYYAAEKARELGILGFVRNEPDGTVYIEAEGEEDALKKLAAWCESGPGHARVLRVDASFLDALKGYKDFTVQYDIS